MRPEQGKVWRKTGRNGREGSMAEPSWLVFYVKGLRVGSVPATAANRAEAHRQMRLSLIQRDQVEVGGEHYSVLSLTSYGLRVTAGGVS
jgi:hypothetical protein